MINIKLTELLNQKRMEKNKDDLKTIYFYKNNLYKLEKTSKKLNKQYENKKDNCFFETEIFKLNDSVAYALKNFIKFGLSSQETIYEIMKSKKPVKIHIC